LRYSDSIGLGVSRKLYAVAGRPEIAARIRVLSLWRWGEKPRRATVKAAICADSFSPLWSGFDQEKISD